MAGEKPPTQAPSSHRMTCLFLILKQLCSLNLLGLPRLEQHRDCEDFAPSISLSAGGQSHPPREDETRRWDQAPQLVSFRVGLAARGFSKNGPGRHS